MEAVYAQFATSRISCVLLTVASSCTCRVHSVHGEGDLSPAGVHRVLHAGLPGKPGHGAGAGACPGATGGEAQTMPQLHE